MTTQHCSLEFQTALFGLRLLTEQSLKNEGTTDGQVVQVEVDTERGRCFSASGPALYAGNILNDPECVWSEDVWQDEDTFDAEQRIRAQGDVLPAFWKNEYETMANKYWHKFYRRNTTNFYKDRHYLHLICKELLDGPHGPSEFNHMLEVGCGVGNAVLPLLELNDHLFVHCIDFARSAIELLRSNPLIASTGNRLIADVCDVVRDDLPATVPMGGVDVVMCMFVLSALPPDSLSLVLRKLAGALRPGGILFIRDYGRYDEAQLRFKKGSKLDDHFYVRQDGTCAYYFDLEELVVLAESLTKEVEEQKEHSRDDSSSNSSSNKDGVVDSSHNSDNNGSSHDVGSRLFRRVGPECFYIHRQYANRAQARARRRVWIQVKLVKL